MFKRINSKENKENRWPCIICDEWSWDVFRDNQSSLGFANLF